MLIWGVMVQTKACVLEQPLLIDGFFQLCFQGSRKCLRASQKRVLNHLTDLTKRGRQADRQGQSHWQGRAGSPGFNRAVVPGKQKPEACV